MTAHVATAPARSGSRAAGPRRWAGIIAFNGVDDDGDLTVDCGDITCCFEPGCAESEVCRTLEEIAVACGDGVDDDGDGASDCDDPSCCPFGCEGSPACAESGEQCGDGWDNDGDRATDCADHDCCLTWPACASQETCSMVSREVCDNGGDDDGDGAVDCADMDCCDRPGCPACGTESGDGLCSDGQDNDRDGAVDCDDPSCCMTTASCGEMTDCSRLENTPELCTNGVDDDGDSRADCDDESCLSLAGICGTTGCVESSVAPTDPLIDDFEDGDLRILPVDGQNGGWFAIANGLESAPRIENSGTPSGNWLVYSFLAPGDLVGVALTAFDGLPCPYNASYYPGIEVDLTSSSASLRIRAITAESVGCTSASCPKWEYAVPASGGSVVVTWDDFTDTSRPGDHPDPARLIGFDFDSASTSSAPVVKIDNLRFVAPVYAPGP